MVFELSHPVASCPPHHWFIGGSQGRQRWSCQKCGLVRTEERRPIEARRLANMSTWSRDEVALLDAETE